MIMMVLWAMQALERVRGADTPSHCMQVEEMDRDEALAGWTYPCRCGEAFQVRSCVSSARGFPTPTAYTAPDTTQLHPHGQVLEEELPEGASILVTCDGCSLRARVHRGRGNG
jgi:hypothetical protein